MIALVATAALLASVAAELPTNAEVVQVVREQPTKLCASMQDGDAVSYKCIEARNAEPVEIVCRTGPALNSASCDYRVDFRFIGRAGSEKVVMSRGTVQLRQLPDESWTLLPISNSAIF